MTNPASYYPINIIISTGAILLISLFTQMNEDNLFEAEVIKTRFRLCEQYSN